MEEEEIEGEEKGEETKLKKTKAKEKQQSVGQETLEKKKDSEYVKMKAHTKPMKTQ